MTVYEATFRICNSKGVRDGTQAKKFLYGLTRFLRVWFGRASEVVTEFDLTLTRIIPQLFKFSRNEAYFGYVCRWSFHGFQSIQGKKHVWVVYVDGCSQKYYVLEAVEYKLLI